MTTTPSTVRSDVSDWLIVCDRLCATLSMSLVTRLKQLAPGLAVEVAEGQPVDLRLRPGCGAVGPSTERRRSGQVSLQPAQPERGSQIDDESGSDEHEPDRTEVDAPVLAPDTPWRPPCSRWLRLLLASAAAASSRDSPGGSCRPKMPAKTRSVARARIRGAMAVSPDAGQGKEKDHAHLAALGSELTEHPLRRRKEAKGLLGDHRRGAGAVGA